MSKYRTAKVLSRSDSGLLYHTIEVAPITPVIGAEVRGVDLSQPLPEQQWAEIHQAFLQHLVLFFRGQVHLSPEQQIRFGHLFGELHVHPAAPCLSGYPQVMVIHADQSSKSSYGESWHSDVSCDTEPPLCSILQIHVLPPSGGDTLFSSMYAAYDTLSPQMKQFLIGLTALHESEHHYRGRYADRGVNDAGRVYPRAEHPVICTHPESGRRCIFVNSTFTTHIQGLNPSESESILQFLFKHVEDPYFQVRFKWQQNDVVIWDNRCTQHIAMWDYWPHERKGHRVTVKGTAPIFRASETPSGATD